LKHMDASEDINVLLGRLEANNDLGGEPVKIEASASKLSSELSDKAQAVKLALPVKLLRLDESMHIAQYEADADNNDVLQQDEPAEQDFYLPPRSKSTSDAWRSPFASPYDPWLGFAAEHALQPMFDYGAHSFGNIDDPLEVASMVLSPISSPVLASAGSSLHGSGRCRPCAWFWKPGSCQNLDNCSYCHLCPEGELKSRKKAKVAMMRLGVVTPKAKGPAIIESAGNVLRLSSLL
jgi:hypothetical protein